MKAIIISRCSTDETRQSVSLQTQPCIEYCKKQGWDYEVLEYYASGSKGIPPELQRVLDLIAQKKYDVLVIYSMDRFSRQKPSLTEKMLNHIIECKCRFISLQENLDSDNPMIWYCFKGIWLYFANQYSLNLSDKVKRGMKLAKEEGKQIGRPVGSKDKRRRSNKGYLLRKYKFKGNSGGK